MAPAQTPVVAWDSTGAPPVKEGSTNHSPALLPPPTLPAGDAAELLTGRVDWAEARRFVDLIGRQGGDLVLTVFPPEPNQPCIHLPGRMDARHQKQVEATLQRHPGHSLGLVLNPAFRQPETWGDSPDDRNRNGQTKTWGASSTHIARAVGIWAECDGGLPLELQERLPELASLPAPTATVWSGGKSLHLYWLLDEWAGELLPSTFRDLQRRLVAAISAISPETKADASLCNANRVMRLPGGCHPRTKQRCRIHSDGGPRYTVEELERLIPLPDPKVPPVATIHLPATPIGGTGLPPRPPETLREALLQIPPFRHKAGQYNVLLGLAMRLHVDLGADVAQQLLAETCCREISDLQSYFGSVPGQISPGSTWPYLRDQWGVDISRRDLRDRRTPPPHGTPLPPAASPERPPGAPAKPTTFEERWSALEREAGRLAATEAPLMRVLAELKHAAEDLDLRGLPRTDLQSLLEAAQRRLRPGAAPILPGGRFAVRPALWAVDGLIRHGLNLLVGQPGAGKTRFALALAATWLKGGGVFLDRNIDEARPVEERALLILGPDMDLSDWGAAMEPLGLVQRHPGGDYQLHERVTLHGLETGVVLDADGLALVRRWCDQHPGGMVVADSLAQLLPPGTDEDKAAAGRPIHALNEALGSCWGLLLHHARKAAGRERNIGIGAGRGSSAIEGAASRVLTLGLTYKKEGREWVAQEGDDRRELLSTKRGGGTLHLIVRSDGSGAWHCEGSAAAFKAAETRAAARDNLSAKQFEVLTATAGLFGWSSTRTIGEAMGIDWEADTAEGGKRAAGLRKVLSRLMDLGLLETKLQGSERLYRHCESVRAEALAAEGGEYESPERMRDTAEEMLPFLVREERDAERIWARQHDQRTAAEAAAPTPPLPEPSEVGPPAIGEMVKIMDNRGGWEPGYRVVGVTGGEILLKSEATGRTLTKRNGPGRPQWRRIPPSA